MRGIRYHGDWISRQIAMTLVTTRVLLCAVLLCLACRRTPADVAQESTPSTSGPSTPSSDPSGFSAATPRATTATPRATTSASELQLLFPPAPTHLASGTVSARYDKFKDSWTVISHSVLVEQDKPQGPYDIRSRPISLRLGAAVVRPGQQPPAIRRTDKVVILLTSFATDWQFLADRDLRVIADGRRYSFATVRTSRVAPLEETLLADVPVAQFLEIVNASSTEWQAGMHEFRVAPDGIDRLRTFASILPLRLEHISQLLSNGPSENEPAPSAATPNLERVVSRFSERVRTMEATPKFYIDDAARIFHVPACPDVRPTAMTLVLKPVVVLKQYTAHTCVSEAELRDRRLARPQSQ